MRVRAGRIPLGAEPEPSMEFRCRLVTPAGEIIEGVYDADNEARLRREFEDKGLYVLGIQRAGRLAFGNLALPRRSRIPAREFIVFNQEMATLLKAGMPLVQSLDILRQRVTNPLLKTVLDEAAKTHRTMGNVLFYLATPPEFFGEIVRRLGEAGLVQREPAGWRRVVIEKPF